MLQDFRGSVVKGDTACMLSHGLNWEAPTLRESCWRPGRETHGGREREREEAHTVPTVPALGAGLFPCATHGREGAPRHPQPQMPSD